MKKAGKRITALLIAVLTVFICLFSSACTKVGDFAVVRDGTYIFSDMNGMKVRDSLTLSVKMYGGDDNIEVSLTPLKLDKDYQFKIGGRSFRWNKNIISGGVELGKYADISIDQEANTVTINSTVGEILTNFAKAKYATDDVDVNPSIAYPLPTSDMFRLDIMVGDSKMSFGCSLLSSAQNIVLSDESIQVKR